MGISDWVKEFNVVTGVIYRHDRHPDSFYAEAECFWHGYERRDGAYRICLECDHVYRMEKDLIRAHRQLAWSIGYQYWLKSFLMPTGDIWSCPLCNHDW